MKTIAHLAAALAATLPAVALAGEGAASPIPVEDYARYDQIITSKFLSSETQLVLLERTTATQISPEQEIGRAHV